MGREESEMNHYTKKDILKMVDEEDVGFIRLQFTDIFGTMKNIVITAGQLERALDNQIIFDGASIEGVAGSVDSDMYLYPDLDTFVIFPWRPQQGKSARLICDVYKPDGTAFESDPRYILKKVLAEARALGYEFDAGVECEFFLFHTDEDGRPTTLSHENASYFDMGPLDLGENARRDIVMTLEDMGLTIEASHHEKAPAQHRIDFRYDEALKTADNIMTFKQAARTIAKRHGLHAAFMPKPKYGVNGSGMHINMSLVKDGINIFTDAEDEKGLSREAYCFIGGIMKHIKAVSFIANPNVNSYKRLVPGCEAPVYTAWSAGNRTSLLRTTLVRGSGVRVELKSPDPLANPYLALAVCLAAGLDGISNEIMPPQSVDGNVSEMTEAQRKEAGIEALPGSLHEAAEEFARDTYIQSVLGAGLSGKYIQAKEKEFADYSAQVTGWELERYLHHM